MTVKVRPYKRGGWEVDIVVQLGDGRPVRRRLKSPVSSKSGSLAWGQKRERHFIEHGIEPGPGAARHVVPARADVPTLAEFAPRYIEGYARANRQKASSIDSKLSHLSAHLLPRFGHKRLDELGDEEIQGLKSAFADKSAKTVNNVLTTLNTLLTVAVQWGVLEHMPAKIKLLKVTRREMAFYDFDEYDRLVEAAAKIDPGVLLQDHGPHTLRHTFCSHLAMQGAPTKAIQELAGHADLTTTQHALVASGARRIDPTAEAICDVGAGVTCGFLIFSSRRKVDLCPRRGYALHECSPSTSTRASSSTWAKRTPCSRKTLLTS